MAHTLYILSIGAGGTQYLTTEAKQALASAEVVVGYRNYVKELSSLLEGKQCSMSGMTKERERCQEAIDYAKEGKTTCILSNGDAHVFGIASDIVELMDEQDLWESIHLESIAGVTALLAVANRMGAPLTQDFATISLSDKYTSAKLIEKRVALAIEGDFTLGIYSPKSKKHYEPYLNFLEQLASIEPRIVIIASQIGRAKEHISITTSTALAKKGLEHPEITMSTLLIVCNSQTKRTKNGLVLAPWRREEKKSSF